MNWGWTQTAKTFKPINFQKLWFTLIHVNCAIEVVAMYFFGWLLCFFCSHRLCPSNEDASALKCQTPTTSLLRPSSDIPLIGG